MALTFHKGAEAIQWRKDSFFNRWCWDNWTFMYKKINLDTDLSPFKKNQLKVNCRPECKMQNY